MATVINILPQQNIRERVIVRLTDPPSSIRSKHDGMKSGLIRISNIERLKQVDKKLIKYLKFWMPSLSEIHVAGNTEQEQTEITEQKYDDVAECLQFIRSCGNKYVILILSHDHAQNKEVVSTFKKLPQIIALYCYKTEESFKELRKNWFTEGQSFARDILPRNVIGTQTKDLDKASQLLLTQIFLSELIVNLPREDKAKEDFITFCHSMYRNHPAYPTFREKIEHFNRTYREQDVIEWYTDPESFVFCIVSKTCANFDNVTLFETRLILRDLYIRLQKLHEEQLEDLLKQDITVYRSKMMSKNELSRIEINQGLFITRHFLSTSTNKDVAAMHSGDGAIATDEVSVLISMKIDRTDMHDKPVAFIGDHNRSGSESEALLPMGMVFRFDSIKRKRSESRYWVLINMIRSDDEKQIEKNLSRFHLVTQTGATCATLGMIPFLVSTGNDQHIEKYSKLMSHALKSSNPEIAQQLSAISNSNIQPVLVS
jgi:GTPase SAR1 family protein